MPRPEPWIKKDKQHQQRQLRQGIQEALKAPIEDGEYISVRPLDWRDFWLLKQQKLKPEDVPENARARNFIVRFKGNVKVRTVTEIINAAFDRKTLGDLQK